MHLLLNRWYSTYTGRGIYCANCSLQRCHLVVVATVATVVVVIVLVVIVRGDGWHVLVQFQGRILLTMCFIDRSKITKRKKLTTR